MSNGSLTSLIGGLSHGTFSLRLEKHFDDVKKGIGDYSRDVPFELNTRSYVAADALSQSNPKALKMMSGYQTGMRYDRAARMMDGITYGVEVMSQLRRVV